jgi:hypothetical protein
MKESKISSDQALWQIAPRSQATRMLATAVGSRATNVRIRGRAAIRSDSNHARLCRHAAAIAASRPFEPGTSLGTGRLMGPDPSCVTELAFLREAGSLASMGCSRFVLFQVSKTKPGALHPELIVEKCLHKLIALREKRWNNGKPQNVSRCWNPPTGSRPRLDCLKSATSLD